MTRIGRPINRTGRSVGPRRSARGGANGVRLGITHAGFDELIDNLRAFGDHIADQAAGKAARAGANVIKKAAKGTVRVDRAHLKRAISVKLLRNAENRRRTALVGIAKKRFPDKRRKGGFDQPSARAHLEEFGANGRPGSRFLTRATDMSGAEVLRAMAEVLAHELLTLKVK